MEENKCRLKQIQNVKKIEQNKRCKNVTLFSVIKVFSQNCFQQGDFPSDEFPQWKLTSCNFLIGTERCG